MGTHEIEGREALTVKLDQIGQDLKTAYAERDKVNKIISMLCKRQEKYLALHFATFTDEELIADEAALLQLCRAAFNGAAAHKRQRELMKPAAKELDLQGIDGRKEYELLVLPNLHLMLDYGQDTDHLVPMIEDWCAKFALGRKDVYLGVLEHTCSEHGVWGMLYDPASKVARVTFLRYYRETEKLVGTLQEALDYLAKHAWYTNGPEGYDGYLYDD